jgi:CMP-N,N'-diacetyllegionaminic acid synthase
MEASAHGRVSPIYKRLLVVVPARGGSKRLPGKNVRSLGGRPLLAWTVQTLQEAALDATCLLTTDHPEIRKIGQSLGLWAPFLRPEELATDAASMEDTVLHALDFVREAQGRDPELLMLLQPTTPFRRSADLWAAIECLEKNPSVDAVIGARAVGRTPAQLFIADENGRLGPLGTGKERVLTANGALYLVRTPAFRRHKRFSPPNTVPFDTAPESDIDIDTERDWMLAEMMHSKWIGRQREQSGRRSGI